MILRKFKYIWVMMSVVILWGFVIFWIGGIEILWGWICVCVGLCLWVFIVCYCVGVLGFLSGLNIVNCFMRSL